MLKEYDAEVAKYVGSLRVAGGIVNRSIVIAAAKGIVSHGNPSLLKEHGGPINIVGCHSYVKRKATKAARKQPADFPEINLQRIKSEVETKCNSTRPSSQLGSN